MKTIDKYEYDLRDILPPVKVYLEPEIECTDGKKRKYEAVAESDNVDEYLVGKIRTIEYKKKCIEKGIIFTRRWIETRRIDVFEEKGHIERGYIIAINSEKIREMTYFDEKKVDREYIFVDE